MGSPPSRSTGVCSSSAKAGLWQGSKGVVGHAVGLWCAKDTRVSGRENSAKPSTVLFIFFTLFSIDKSVPLGIGCGSIIGPRLTATVKQSLVCCAVGTKLNIKKQA